MLDLDIKPNEMTSSELETWIFDCNIEIDNAYEQDNIREANQLIMMRDMVQSILNKKMKTESFKDYCTRHLMNERYIINEAEDEPSDPISIIDVDEDFTTLQKKLKDATVTLNSVMEFDENNELVNINPIVVDIAFNLEYLEDEQHITITYTPASLPEAIDIDEIPTKDYKATASENGTIVTFKSLTNFADMAEDLELYEDIEWPFDMTLDNATAQKKFDKAKNTAAKIIMLLGSEYLIDKVRGYKSSHASGSNKATRNAREAEAIKTAVQNNANTRRTRTEVLTDMLKSIKGVTDVTVHDVAGNGLYTKRLRVYAPGGYIDVFSAGRDFRVSPNNSSFGNSRSFGPDMSDDKHVDLNDYRNDVVAYVTSLINKFNVSSLTPRERMLKNTQTKRTAVASISDKVTEFKAHAEAFNNGDTSITLDQLTAEYEYLADNESQLNDADYSEISDIANELNL